MKLISRYVKKVQGFLLTLFHDSLNYMKREPTMTIEIDLDDMTERGRKLLLMKANQWQCPPSSAMFRLIDEAAKRAKVTVPTLPHPPVGIATQEVTA